MVKPSFRTKSVGTKVTDEEYARFEALAAGQSMSEWVRDTLLAADRPASASPADEALMAELLALRTILLNVLFKVANGEKVSAEAMQQLIDRADGDKLKKAAERLQR